jgi:hypothetical protein
VGEMRMRIHFECPLVNVSMIRRQLKIWKFTHKVAFAVQRDKFTFYNLSYYVEYVRWFSKLVKDGDSYRIKVLDEVHFDGRSGFSSS